MTQFNEKYADDRPVTTAEWEEAVRHLRREVVAARDAAEVRCAAEIHRLRSELAQAQAHIIALRARVYERPVRDDPASTAPVDPLRVTFNPAITRRAHR